MLLAVLLARVSLEWPSMLMRELNQQRRSACT